MPRTAQLDDAADFDRGNAGTLISIRLGREDASIIAREFKL